MGEPDGPSPGRAGCRAGSVGCDAHVRLPLRRLRRDHRGPAGLLGRPADRGDASGHRRGEGGQEGLHAGRGDVQGRRLLQDRQPRVVVAHGRRRRARRRPTAARQSSDSSGNGSSTGVEQGVEQESATSSTGSSSSSSSSSSSPTARRRRPAATDAAAGSVAGTDIPRRPAIGRITMNPLARLRHVLARRPWLYWLGVAVVALAIGLVAVRAAASVDEARRRWGTTREVAVADRRPRSRRSARRPRRAAQPTGADGPGRRPSPSSSTAPGPGSTSASARSWWRPISSPSAAPQALIPPGWSAVAVAEAVPSGAAVGDRRRRGQRRRRRGARRGSWSGSATTPSSWPCPTTTPPRWRRRARPATSACCCGRERVSASRRRRSRARRCRGATR